MKSSIEDEEVHVTVIRCMKRRKRVIIKQRQESYWAKLIKSKSSSLHSYNEAHRVYIFI